MPKEHLEKIAEESEKQERPDQKSVVTVSPKILRRLHNLPDPTNPPLGWDETKASFAAVYPYLKIPALHPRNHGDTVIFNDRDAEPNKLYLGDNLEVLRTLPSESIDLIYIDPPFFSGRNYNMIWGDTNEVRSFNDIWEGGITTYLIWLNARLWEMRRVLKKTGSIYVHCDWHASHYIKTEMDKIFGYENFDTEIIWKSTSAHANNKTYGLIHQIIFFYQKENNAVFNTPYVPYDEEYIEKYYRYRDENGRRFMSGDLVGHEGVNKEYEWRGIVRPWRYPKEKLDKLEKEGKLFWTKNNFPRYKRYLDEMPGMPAQSIWADKESQYLTSWGGESIGYPTQKPEALLERIIKASSNEGDVVADFFCGGGTTLAVAQKLKRNFIGCDSSRIAISVTLDRLIKVGEEISGVKSNVSAKDESFQLKLQAKGTTEKVPNIEVWYLGVYPIEKFQNLDQNEFVDFVLTSYGASKNTGEGVTSGFRPPAQQEPILVGPSDPGESVDPKVIKKFFDEN